MVAAVRMVSGAGREAFEQLDRFLRETLPEHSIGQIVSPIYGESTNRAGESLASYAMSRYASQLILMTHALDGRRDQSYMFHTHIVLEHPRYL
jgi:hypothetical protein